MKELINFSTYASDTVRFNHDGAAIARYVQAHGVDGIELLLSDEPPPALPPGVVQAVHLPFWVSWHDIWSGTVAYPHAATTDEAMFYRHIYGGASRDDLVAAQRRLWHHAALLNPAYMVFHVSYTDVAYAFTRAARYTDVQVCAMTADLLNAVAATFADGEPPVCIALENLWCPGLTFTDNALAEYFIEHLHFDNWSFVLDTGHLMSVYPGCTDEQQAIDFVLATIERLSPAVRKRITTLHFHLSLSGSYQQQALYQGLPAGFSQMTVIQQHTMAREHVVSVDLHSPFTSPRCQEIVAALRPQFLTHEFLSDSTEEYDGKLLIQRTALHQQCYQ